MCYWERQHWIRTKSIHSAEFFHGMLEIIDKDTPVTVFIGEDSQESLSERVTNFLPRICGKYNIIDTKKFELKGISPEYRGYISHLVMHAVTQRIDVHIGGVIPARPRGLRTATGTGRLRAARARRLRTTGAGRGAAQRLLG